MNTLKIQRDKLKEEIQKLQGELAQIEWDIKVKAVNVGDKYQDRCGGIRMKTNDGRWVFVDPLRAGFYSECTDREICTGTKVN